MIELIFVDKEDRGRGKNFPGKTFIFHNGLVDKAIKTYVLIEGKVTLLTWAVPFISSFFFLLSSSYESICEDSLVFVCVILLLIIVQMFPRVRHY